MGSGSSKLRRFSQSAKKSRSEAEGGGSTSLPRSMSFPTDGKTMPQRESDSVTFMNGSSVHAQGVEQKDSSETQTSDPDQKLPNENVSAVKGSESFENGNGLTFIAGLSKSSNANGSEYSSSLKSYELYNLITAETWQGLPQIHDSGYMLLLDCRDRASYEKLHIVTARHHTALYSEYGLLLPSQLKLFHVIILYSSASCPNIPAFSKKLSEDKVDHYVLQSGCSEFLSSYPFLASSQALSFMSEIRKTLQTMPSEIIPGRLYQGTAKHALDSYIIKSLGITHVVNVTLEHPNRFEDTVQYMRIQLDDKPHVDLQSWLPATTKFIQSALGTFSLSDEMANDGHRGKNEKGAVLVHCNMGRSRSSTVVLGYLMQAHKYSLGGASRHLKDCRPTVRPNAGFLEQLLNYEKETFGRNITQFSDLPF